MFGLMILTKSKLEKITETIRETEYEIAYHNAMREIVDILKQSDKVYLEPVNIVGDKVALGNSTFLGISGNAVSVDAKKVNIRNCVMKDISGSAVRVVEWGE
jgi:hypothetical protein